MEHVIDLCAMSEKFFLPDGGQLFDDPDCRGLADGFELRLPYQFVALEFSTSEAPIHRHVLFAREHDEVIVLSVARFHRANGLWTWLPHAALSKRGLRTNDAGVRQYVGQQLAPDAQEDGLYDPYYEVLLQFLSALQCSNVVDTKLSARGAARKKAKDALPFDEYHVLTLRVSASAGGGARSRGTPGAPSSRASPREHLRRGHMVCPEGRRPFWRNATTVCADRGAGRVHKDYRLVSRPELAPA